MTKLPPVRDRVQHIIKIERWNCDFMFGVDETKFRTGPHYDYRHLHLRGPILRPADMKAPEAEVTCFADYNAHAARTDETTQKVRHRMGGGAPEVQPVGYLSYRGKHYSANLHMPPDALPLVLQMLAAGKYRFVAFEAAKSFRGEAPIFSFRFSESESDD